MQENKLLLILSLKYKNLVFITSYKFRLKEDSLLNGLKVLDKINFYMLGKINFLMNNLLFINHHKDTKKDYIPSL